MRGATGPSSAAAGVAAGHRADAGHELAEPERLHDVVVGAELEARPRGRPRRQRAVTTMIGTSERARSRRHTSKPSRSGQPEVEQHDVVRRLPRRARPRRCRSRRVRPRGPRARGPCASGSAIASSSSTISTRIVAAPSRSRRRRRRRALSIRLHRASTPDGKHAPPASPRHGPHRSAVVRHRPLHSGRAGMADRAPAARARCVATGACGDGRRRRSRGRRPHGVRSDGGPGREHGPWPAEPQSRTGPAGNRPAVPAAAPAVAAAAPTTDRARAVARPAELCRLTTGPRRALSEVVEHLGEVGGQRLLDRDGRRRSPGGRTRAPRRGGTGGRAAMPARCPPYAASPTTGCPIAWRCTRIWCVRPVSSSQREPGARRARGRCSTHLVARAGLAAALARPPCGCGRRTDRPMGASITPRGDVGHAPHRARVAAVDVVGGERRDQRLVRGRRPRHDEQPAGVAVEAVDDARDAPGRRRRRSRGTGPAGR